MMPQPNSKSQFQGTGTSSFSLTTKDDVKPSGAGSKKATPSKTTPSKTTPKKPSTAAKAPIKNELKKEFMSPKSGSSKDSKKPAISSLNATNNPKSYVKMNPNRVEDKPGKIIVLGLPMKESFKEKDFEKLFSPYGRITETYIIVDRRKNSPRGYGFITFENPSDAVDAKKALEGKDIGGKEPIHIEQAFIDATLPKSQADRGGFRGRGSRGRGVNGRGRGPGRGISRGRRGGPAMRDGRYIQPLMSLRPEHDYGSGRDYQDEYIDEYEDDFGMDDPGYGDGYGRDVNLEYTIDDSRYEARGYDEDFAYERRGGDRSLRHSPERQPSPQIRRPLSRDSLRPQVQGRPEIVYRGRAEPGYDEEVYDSPRGEVDHRRSDSIRMSQPLRREPVGQSRGPPPSRGERAQPSYDQKKTLLPTPMDQPEEEFYDVQPGYPPAQRGREHHEAAPGKRIRIVKVYHDDGYVEERIVEEYQDQINTAPARPVPARGRGGPIARGRGGPPSRSQPLIVLSREQQYDEPVYIDDVPAIRSRQEAPQAVVRAMRGKVPVGTVVRGPQRTGVLGDSPYVEDEQLYSHSRTTNQVYEEDIYNDSMGKRMPPPRRRESPPQSADRYGSINSGREPLPGQPRSRAPLPQTLQRGPTEPMFYAEDSFEDSGYRQAPVRKRPEPEMRRVPKDTELDFYTSYNQPQNYSEERPSRKRPLIESYPDDGGDFRSSGPSSSRQGPILGSRPAPPKRERIDYGSSDRRRR